MKFKSLLLEITQIFIIFIKEKVCLLEKELSKRVQITT